MRHDADDTSTRTGPPQSARTRFSVLARTRFPNDLAPATASQRERAKPALRKRERPANSGEVWPSLRLTIEATMKLASI